ncbi:hypothetical protein GCM10019016_091610 [Streptomyces prasinosporus]|uniref:Uncharacterized protein n=1 Tax=Streptomyces prasinosporus TaxID=68256 RepID=A0ABP6U315_9ACTN
MAATHRIVTGTVITAVCLAALAGCGTGADGGGGRGGPEQEKAQPAPAPKNVVRLIGDGSTAYTGRPAAPARSRSG